MPGIKKGLMRLGPFSKRTLWKSSIIARPPNPDPVMHPTLWLFLSSILRPESSKAILAEAIPKCMKISNLLACCLSKNSSDLKPFTSPAIREAKGDASNLVMGPIPDLPAHTASQFSLTPIPSGVTIPRPVTTTLLFIFLTPFFSRFLCFILSKTPSSRVSSFQNSLQGLPGLPCWAYPAGLTLLGLGPKLPYCCRALLI